jgi:hypothetical protein
MLSKSKDLQSNFINGGKAGFLSGIIIAPFEFRKVYTQVQEISGKLNAGSKSIKAILPFSCMFSAVCAIEFSVNDFIKNQYGIIAGLGASSLTGGMFLTAADHLMFRQTTGQSISYALKQLAGRKLFTGLSPMVIREVMFISSVLYIGPYIGSGIGSKKDGGNLLKDFLGRLLSGVFTTILSQPFDSFARELQKMEYQNKSVKILDCLKEIKERHRANNETIFKHPLLKGALPRIPLATFGGALAGFFFDYFKNKSKDD